MKRVQFPHDVFCTQTWRPIHYFVHKYGRPDVMWKRSIVKCAPSCALTWFCFLTSGEKTLGISSVLILKIKSFKYHEKTSYLPVRSVILLGKKGNYRLSYKWRNMAPLRNYLDFYSFKSPFLGFRVIQMGYRRDFNLESVFIFKNIFDIKNVPDFRKTVETGVDPHLQYRIRAPSFKVSKERIHLFLSATGRGECNSPCHAKKYY